MFFRNFVIWRFSIRTLDITNKLLQSLSTSLNRGSTVQVVSSENRKFLLFFLRSYSCSFIGFDYFLFNFGTFLKFRENPRWRIHEGRHLPIMTKNITFFWLKIWYMYKNPDVSAKTSAFIRESDKNNTSRTHI